MKYLMMFLLALAVKFVSRRPSAPRRRAAFAINNLSIAIPFDSAVNFDVQRKTRGCKPQYRTIKILYCPNSALRASLSPSKDSLDESEEVHFIALRDVEGAPPLPDILNLRVFDQILQIHATPSRLSVELQVVTPLPSPPDTPPDALAAVVPPPRFKIIARRAA